MKAVDLDPKNANAVSYLADCQVLMRKFPEAVRTYERGLESGLNDPMFPVRIALADFAATGNRDKLRTALAAAPSNSDNGGGQTSLRILLALMDHKYDEAERVLAASPRQDFQDIDYSFPFPRSWYEAIIARARGDKEKARIAFSAARTVLEGQLRNTPSPRTVAVLAEVYAGLGLKELALGQVSMPVERFPISRDAYMGPLVLQSLAQIAAWTGDKPRALETLKTLLKYPGYISYGYLLCDPAWDPLRRDPEFQALVQSQDPLHRSSQLSDPKVVSRRSAASYVADPPRNSPRIEREPGVADDLEGAIPHLNVIVSDSAGKVAYRSVTDSKGTFATPMLNPGKYVVQFASKKVIDARGASFTLVVSAGKKKVTAESFAGQKFAGGGVAMKIEFAADASVSGQVTTMTATARNLVWIKQKLGSNLPGHWAAADSAEAKEAMRDGGISRDNLQARQNQGAGMPIAPPALTYR
jgi:tetratricopeptide (TPR) repeat protein